MDREGGDPFGYDRVCLARPLVCVAYELSSVPDIAQYHPE